MSYEEPTTGAGVDSVIAALRGWYGAFSNLGRQFGLATGMHHSDAAALIQITDAEQRGRPVSQSELRRQIGLSVPATSALVSRLERAGFVERHPHSHDRRIVTLRSTPEVHTRLGEFFEDVAIDLDRIAAQYPARTLTAMSVMLNSMTDAMTAQLGEMLGRESEPVAPRTDEQTNPRR